MQTRNYDIMEIAPFLISQKEVAKLDRVTSPEIVVKKVPNVEYTMDNYGYAWRFHPDGLFSENIFGCVLDYTCACPRVWTTEEAIKAKYCPSCGAKLTLAKARRMITATIELPVSIINPLIALQAYKQLPLIDNKHFVLFAFESREQRNKHMPSDVKLATGPELTNYIKYDTPIRVVHPALIWILAKWLYIERPTLIHELDTVNVDALISDTAIKTETQQLTLNNKTIDVPTYEKLKSQVPDYARPTVLYKQDYLSNYEIVKILQFLARHYKSLTVNQQNKLLAYLKLPNDFAIYRYIEVLPPDLRPIVFDSKVYHIATERVNSELWPILRIRYAKIIEPVYPDLPFDYYDTYSEIVSHVHKYYQILMDKIIKKNQVIRGHRLGKRVDLSARAVLVGNPSLKPDEVILPYLFGLMLYYPYILKRYSEHKNIDYSTADKELQDMIESRTVSDNLKTILDKFLEDNRESMYVIIMRQPVLHIPSTNVFRICAWSDDIVIQMNQLSWPGYNADCDGDSIVSKVKLTVFDKNNKDLKTVVFDLAEQDI